MAGYSVHRGWLSLRYQTRLIWLSWAPRDYSTGEHICWASWIDENRGLRHMLSGNNSNFERRPGSSSELRFIHQIDYCGRDSISPSWRVDDRYRTNPGPPLTGLQSPKSSIQLSNFSSNDLMTSHFHADVMLQVHVGLQSRTPVGVHQSFHFRHSIVWTFGLHEL